MSAAEIVGGAFVWFCAVAAAIRIFRVGSSADHVCDVYCERREE